MKKNKQIIFATMSKKLKNNYIYTLWLQSPFSWGPVISLFNNLSMKNI